MHRDGTEGPAQHSTGLQTLRCAAEGHSDQVHHRCQVYHRETVRSLGLKRIHHTVVRQADPATVGMLNAVKHLVKVEETN
ncbi:50S ribosomal protein L30 [Nesterenkonia pannonica]|uniref:50S ribosomal protein L30 n=1 Tax=Nesterenkonia pannonica TaxID=1548602 RepID=UPI002164B806|nr:50S ribosomal protein L30 [Nesterenkonia pannonica]